MIIYRYKNLENVIWAREKRFVSMRRKIYDALLKWKRESAGETALLIDGVILRRSLLKRNIKVIYLLTSIIQEMKCASYLRII